jgi:undecaprenyl phosphate-alpha-L-ara4FN deformylase
MRLAPVFEELLRAWQDQGYGLVSLRDYFASLDPVRLPRHEVCQGKVPGRSGTLAVQGPEFLASASVK